MYIHKWNLLYCCRYCCWCSEGYGHVLMESPDGGTLDTECVRLEWPLPLSQQSTDDEQDLKIRKKEANAFARHPKYNPPPVPGF